MLEEDEILDQQRSLILFENELTDDNSGSESTSGLLQSSGCFSASCRFQLGSGTFRIRGLDSENAMTMINGVSMNKSYDGRPQWGNWGGLNDATRNQNLLSVPPFRLYFGGI
jgi:hypothetical protein